jgi:hypothetical protein
MTTQAPHPCEAAVPNVSQTKIRAITIAAMSSGAKFSIDAEDVGKAMGYSRKDNVIRFLNESPSFTKGI